MSALPTSSERLGHLVWRTGHVDADAPAIGDERVTYTYRQLAERIDVFAGALHAFGLHRGDVVGLMLPNCADLVITMFAAWRLGLVVTPINPGLTSQELRHQFDDAQCRLLVTAMTSRDVEVPHLTLDMLQSGPAGGLPDDEVVGDSVALLVYTSGSTGRPKGVVLDHANVEAMTGQFEAHFGLDREDHCLLMLPLFHVNALMASALAMMRVGGRLSILEKFSVTSFPDDLERLRPTYFSAVPSIYIALLAATEDRIVDTSSVRFAICGAAPAPETLVRRAEDRWSFPIVEGYGLSEASCASACNPVHGVRKNGTAGPALPGQRIRIALPNGADAPTGVAGEVQIQGPTVMRGYLNNPEATAAAFDGGWLRTGDVGVLDSDGYLTLVDRIKDMVLRGGENLYPKEIEHVLEALDSVSEAAVVGAPHPFYGEVPVAFVTVPVGREADPASIRRACDAALTKAKVPEVVTILSALPKNSVGKIDKVRLRRIAADTAARGATIDSSTPRSERLDISHDC